MSIVFIPGLSESRAQVEARKRYAKIMGEDVHYSNKGLAPWEGAVCWIEEIKYEGEMFAFARIQLREAFRKKKRFLFFYDREEILKHERIHARRCAFNEPRFEEILAYHVSSSAFQRIVGPLFRHTHEVLLFLSAFLIALFFSWFPIAVFSAILVVRLYIARSTFKLALSKVGSFEVLLHLTDAEIAKVAKLDKEQITAWFEQGESARHESMRGARHP